MEILNALGVKPMQILIQIAGFLLVFGLLAKFLWKPILNLMEEREKEVNGMYSDGEKAKREGEELLSKYKENLAKIETEAQEKIAEAVNRGNEMKDELIQEGRKEAGVEKEKAINAIKDETTKARMELRDFTVTLSMDIASRVLNKEVDRKAHEELVKNFLAELESMN